LSYGRVNPVLQCWLSSADLHQGGFAALVIEFLEPVKAVSAKSYYYLVGIGYAVELLGAEAGPPSSC
jgi:hypothetical protein